MIISSHKITAMGLFIALSVILTRIASLRIAIGSVEGIRIGLGKLPIILGGIISVSYTHLTLPTNREV